MDTKILKGTLAAMAVLLALTALQAALPDWTRPTPMGVLAPADWIAALLAMGVGGRVAGERRFVVVAPLLQLVVASITFVVFLASPGAALLSEARTPAALLRVNGVSLLVGLAAAALGAWLGVRAAQARTGPRGTGVAR